MTRAPYLVPDERVSRPAAREALESKIGLLSLDELQHRRRLLMQEMAPLQSVHGRNGVWDAARRMMRGALATELRETWDREKWGSPTKDAIEDRACASPRYQAFIEQGKQDVVRLLQLETQVLEITEAIKDRESSIWAWGAEARLR